MLTRNINATGSGIQARIFLGKSPFWGPGTVTRVLWEQAVQGSMKPCGAASSCKAGPSGLQSYSSWDQDNSNSNSVRVSILHTCHRLKGDEFCGQQILRRKAEPPVLSTENTDRHHMKFLWVVL